MENAILILDYVIFRCVILKNWKTLFFKGARLDFVRLRLKFQFIASYIAKHDVLPYLSVPVLFGIISCRFVFFACVLFSPFLVSSFLQFLVPCFLIARSSLSCYLFPHIPCFLVSRFCSLMRFCRLVVSSLSCPPFLTSSCVLRVFSSRAASIARSTAA